MPGRGSVSDCNGVVRLVWKPVWKLGNRRGLTPAFDLCWIFWKVRGQMFDMLQCRELGLGLVWEWSVKRQGREWELFDCGWDEQNRWLLVRVFVLWKQLLLEWPSELVCGGEERSSEDRLGWVLDSNFKLVLYWEEEWLLLEAFSKGGDRGLRSGQERDWWGRDDEQSEGEGLWEKVQSDDEWEFPRQRENCEVNCWFGWQRWWGEGANRQSRLGCKEGQRQGCKQKDKEVVGGGRNGNIEGSVKDKHTVDRWVKQGWYEADRSLQVWNKSHNVTDQTVYRQWIWM